MAVTVGGAAPVHVLRATGAIDAEAAPLWNTLSLEDVVFEIVVVKPNGASVILNPPRGMQAGNKKEEEWDSEEHQAGSGVAGNPGRRLSTAQTW